MILKYAPILPEVKDILNQSSTYINKQGKHPIINTIITFDQLEECPTGDNKWGICILDSNLRIKIIEQINIIKMYKDSIYILS